MQQVDLSRIQVRTLRPGIAMDIDGGVHDVVDRALAFAVVCAFWGLIIVTALATLR